MRESAEANKSRILEAARRIVAERGVHNTTLRSIAQEAGLSNGALYYYYNSKDLILYDLMEQQNQVPKKLAQKVKNTEISGDQITDRLIGIFEGRLADEETTKLFMYLAQEAILGDQELQKSFTAEYDEWVNNLEEVLVSLLGVSNTKTSRGLAMILEAVNEGMILRNLLGLDKEEQADALDVMRKILAGNFKEIQEDLCGEKLHQIDT